VILKIRS